MIRKRVSISWSGGKDSAFALYKILQSSLYEVVNLHTVIDEETKRVGLHGVSEDLIIEQAANIGIPLVRLYLPASSDTRGYERLMRAYYKQCTREGIDGIVFGDLFLEDIRDYRLKLLSDPACVAIFPIWGIDTRTLLEEFIQAGFKTVICSANADMFDPGKLGDTIDASFSPRLGPGIDVAGENGEFHTLVYDGPIFKQRLMFEKGDVVKRTYTYQMQDPAGTTKSVETSFWFQDLKLR